MITSEFVCLDRITSSSVSCWEQQSLTRKIFGLVDVEEASGDDRRIFEKKSAYCSVSGSWKCQLNLTPTESPLKINAKTGKK